MDFEIGNIFYIVITLVAVIVGLLGKKKKPTGQGTGETAGETRPGFLENLERALNMEQEKRVVVDLQDYEEDLSVDKEFEEPPPVTVPAPMTLMEEYEQMQAKRRENLTTDSSRYKADITTGSLEVVQLDDDEGTNYFEVIKDFDAGTAVVYAAIINRLDY